MCNSHDSSGRSYAKVSETKAGDWLETDGGFTCLGTSIKKQVKEGPEGLYIECRNGEHYLDGQADDGEHYIGLYPTEAPQ